MLVHIFYQPPPNYPFLCMHNGFTLLLIYFLPYLIYQKLNFLDKPFNLNFILDGVWIFCFVQCSVFFSPKLITRKVHCWVNLHIYLNLKCKIQSLTCSDRPANSVVNSSITYYILPRFRNKYSKNCLIITSIKRVSIRNPFIKQIA